MRVTFLGTGAAGGVPLYGCECAACARARHDPRHVRRPCCALVEHDGTRVLLDAGLTDLHERFAPGFLTAIVLTHFHPDHVQGLFHLRWGKSDAIPVYGPPDTDGCADLFKHPGMLSFRTPRKFEAFEVGALRLTPLPLVHSKPTLGYAIEGAAGERFAYLTDTLGLPPRTAGFLRAWGEFEMAIDCSYPPQPAPKNHNDWHAAHQCAVESGARRTWLTHVSHALDDWMIQDAPVVPSYIALAADGIFTDVATGLR
ncbi:Phosphoribosyl 1,2-cyclic phosphate phosphodiesterase [Thauera mechernichensis]